MRADPFWLSAGLAAGWRRRRLARGIVLLPLLPCKGRPWFCSKEPRRRSVPRPGALSAPDRGFVFTSAGYRGLRRSPKRTTLSGHPASRWIALLGKHGCIPCEGRSGWHELPPNRRQHRQTARLPARKLEDHSRGSVKPRVAASNVPCPSLCNGKNPHKKKAPRGD